MPSYNPTLVDPSVTNDEIQLALEGQPTDYADVLDAQDSLDNFGFQASVPTPPRTPLAAIANLKRLRETHQPIGAPGMCWQNIRWNAWAVAPLWPSAEVGTKNGKPTHRYSNFTDMPRGMTVGLLNGRNGHVVLSLGGGLCDTSDYHELGYNGVALLENVTRWCGAYDWYGIETVNNVDVWPNPKKPRPVAKAWTLAERRAFIHRRLLAARLTGNLKLARQLKAWQDRMDARLAGAK